MSDINIESGDIQLRDLQVLMSVLSTGSFRTAAKRLFTSQAAISRSIARLEHQLATTLVDRGPRGAVATADGEAVVAHARVVLSQLALMRSDVGTARRTSRLRLGVAATSAATYLAPFLSQWLPTNPGVRLEVTENGSAALRHHLAQGDLDLAVVALPVPQNISTAAMSELAIRAYYPHGHWLDRGSPTVSLDELARFGLLLNTPGYLSAELLLRECAAIGVAPEIRYRSQEGQTLAAFAESGLGVAVFAESVDVRAFNLAHRVVVDREGIPLSFTLAAAWNAKNDGDWIGRLGMDLARFTRRRDDEGGTPAARARRRP